MLNTRSTLQAPFLTDGGCRCPIFTGAWYPSYSAAVYFRQSIIRYTVLSTIIYAFHLHHLIYTRPSTLQTNITLPIFYPNSPLSLENNKGTPR